MARRSSDGRNRSKKAVLHGTMSEGEWTHGKVSKRTSLPLSSRMTPAAVATGESSDVGGRASAEVALRPAPPHPCVMQWTRHE